MSASFGIDIDTFSPDFFRKEGELSLDGLEMQVFVTGFQAGVMRSENHSALCAVCLS